MRAVCTAPTDNVARLMALRNASLPAQAIMERSKLALYHLHNLLEQAGVAAERLSLRYIPYPVSFTTVIADPAAKVVAFRARRKAFAPVGIAAVSKATRHGSPARPQNHAVQPTASGSKRSI